MKRRAPSPALFVATALVASLLAVGMQPIDASARVQPPTPVTLDGLSAARSTAIWGSYLYVSVEAGLSASEGDAVAQIGFDGTVHNILGPIAGAFGIATRQGILYVAATDADAIVRYDLSTDPPTKLGSTSISPLTGPRRLVVTNGRIWFDTNCTLSWDARVASMAPDGTDVQQELPLAGDPSEYWTYCAELQGSPTSKRLFLASEGLSPSHLVVYDVSASPYTHLTDDDAGQWTHGEYPTGALYPMTGGTTFAMSGLWGNKGIDIRAFSDFTVVHHYSSTWGGATSIDHTTASGGMFALGYWPGDGSPMGVAVLPDGADSPTAEYEVPDLIPDGVLFTPNGATILALATDSYRTKLYVIDPLDIPSSITLSATPASLTVGDTVDLDGSLSFSDASSPDGRTVTITRTDANGTTPVGQTTTDSTGAYHLTDQPPAGNVTYDATFDAVDHYLSATAQDTVSVDRLNSSVSVKVSKATITFGQTVHITGHLGPGTDSRVIGLYAKPYGDSPVLIKQATVDGNGDLTASYTPKKNTTFIVRFAGDDRYGASHAETGTTKVHVILNAKMVDFASTSGQYKIYKSGTYPKCLVRVAPNHARSNVHFVLQAYVKGAWRTVDKAAFPLNSQSLALVKISLTPGYNARIQATLPSHTDHLGDSSPWLYFRVAG